MSVLGITGGIATGKSSFAKLFTRQTGATLFDADQFSRELLEGDAEVLSAVRRTFGDGVFMENGKVNRAKLREVVFAEEERRRALETILHPVIRSRWLSLAADARSSGEWFVVDIPLLFETEAAKYFDRVITVACQHSVQMRRMLEIRKLDRETAAKIIAAQMDLNLKIALSQHVIWNNGSKSALEAQAYLLASFLRQIHG